MVTKPASLQSWPFVKNQTPGAGSPILWCCSGAVFSPVGAFGAVAIDNTEIGVFSSTQTSQECALDSVSLHFIHAGESGGQGSAHFSQMFNIFDDSVMAE